MLEDGHKFLVKYLRDDNKVPLGCVVATKDDDRGIITGWSYCHRLDSFSRERARTVAIGRALKGKSGHSMPPVLGPMVEDIRVRAEKYFKEGVKSGTD